jgi:hypothetical protein
MPTVPEFQWTGQVGQTSQARQTKQSDLLSQTVLRRTLPVPRQVLGERQMRVWKP